MTEQKPKSVLNLKRGRQAEKLNSIHSVSSLKSLLSENTKQSTTKYATYMVKALGLLYDVQRKDSVALVQPLESLVKMTKAAFVIEESASERMSEHLQVLLADALICQSLVYYLMSDVINSFRLLEGLQDSKFGQFASDLTYIYEQGADLIV